MRRTRQKNEGKRVVVGRIGSSSLVGIKVMMRFRLFVGEEDEDYMVWYLQNL